MPTVNDDKRNAIMEGQNEKRGHRTLEYYVEMDLKADEEKDVLEEYEASLLNDEGDCEE